MLRIKSLAIAYGDRNIFEDVNLEFKRGTVTVIRGASGSGKSSLLHVIGLMQGPKKCNYVFDERIVSDFSENERAEFRLRHVGFVFQQSNLIQELTAKENLIVPMSITDRVGNLEQRAEELLKYVGLEKVQNNYPGSMSGGEEQRLAIVRAIANDAEIILADEPTAALDADNSKMVFELLRKLAHEMNKIVIVVSHSDVAVKYADVVCEIKDRGVVVTKSLDGVKEVTGGSSPDKGIKKRKQWRFVRYYTKKRSGDKALNRVFVAVTALVVAAAILATNFGANFSEAARIESSFTNTSVMVVNNTMGRKGTSGQIDYEEALAILAGDFSKIATINGVDKVYPWYSFFSYVPSGFSEADLRAKIAIEGGVSKTYESAARPSLPKERFLVCPLFEEDDLAHLLEYKASADVADGLILTRSMANSLSSDPSELIGKRIVISFFVPIKLIDTKVTVISGSGEARELSVDQAVYKLVEVQGTVSGILASSYNTTRTRDLDLVFMDSNRLFTIIDSNRSSILGSNEKRLEASAAVVFAESFDVLSRIVSDVRDISSSFTVTASITNTVIPPRDADAAKGILVAVTAAFIVIISVLFCLLYYVKNRARKKEIGILKAVGLKNSNIMVLTLTEMLRVAIPAFVISIALAVIVWLAGNSILGASLFSITPVSIMVGMLVCFVVVIAAGAFPVVSSARVDPIEAMRRINK